MITAVCRLLFAALFAAAGSAFAANPASGVEVLVKNGGATVFQGITDGSGRFSTAPLPPGVYTVEVRPSKTTLPARYFLALGGARPLGAPAYTPNTVTMTAEVTSTKSLSGEVRAIRVIIVPPANAAAATASKPGASASTLPRTAAASASQPAAPIPGRPPLPASAARPIPPLAGSAVSASASPQMRQSSAATASRRGVPSVAPATPAQSAPAAATAVASAANASRTSPAVSSPLVHRPATAQPRIVNGQRQVWVPAAPGSALGRWMPQPGPPPATSPPKPKPRPPSASTTSSSRSQVRR